jgi:hypothetical protein
MSNPCDAVSSLSTSGWGALPYGSGPWAGTYYASSGTPSLPTFSPFDGFCLGPCGSLLVVTLYPEVRLGPAGQWNYDAATGGIRFFSGAEPSGSYLAGWGEMPYGSGPWAGSLPTFSSAVVDAATFFDVLTGISDTFTVEWTISFNSIPTDFNQVTPRYVHIGAGSHQGYIAGLLFSQVGIAAVPDPDPLQWVLPIVPIPNSSGIVELGHTYVIKLVVAEAATYIYITDYQDYVLHGHTLRFVLPSNLTAAACPTFSIDKAWVHALGSESNPVDIIVTEFCQSTSALVPNFPPIAEAKDQAAIFCSIVLLDGSGSVDPEGSPLTYAWRLIDAPSTSGFLFDGLLGRTYPLPMPVGYTDKWYSDQISTLVVGDIIPGDVLVIGDAPYTILALGTDTLHGDYVQVTTLSIPDTLILQTSKVLRQLGISDPTVMKAPFYPDVTGFYKFDLQVYDGVLWSTTVTCVVNVLAAPQPRGVVPDAKFIWEYLSDFWKLVDDKERYSVVWSGLTQFCAAELLNLWQYEYNKSLRDIQRTFQRRWLNYTLRYKPATTTTALRTLFASYDSQEFDTLVGVDGKTLTFYLPTSTTYTVTFYTPMGSSSVGVDEVAAQIRAVLPSSFTVTVTPFLTAHKVRVTASHPFSVIATTLAEFQTAVMTSTLGGSSGSVVWGGTAYCTGVCLSGFGIAENDFLELNGVLYRVIKLQSFDGTVQDDTVVVKDIIPSTAPAYWSIPCYFRKAEADFWGQLVSVGDDAVVHVLGTAAAGDYYKAYVLGASEYDPTVLAVELAGLDLFLTASSSYTLDVLSVYRRHYMPISPLVVDIPTLQEILTDVEEKFVLRRNLDYFLEKYRDRSCIRFDDRIWVHEVDGVLTADAYPPMSLWAEITYLDNRPTIESNFGLPVNFTLENLASLNSDVDYLSAVRGLWYSYFNGPRVQLLRQGAQILLGLPFAEEAGTIEEIRSDYSHTTGRLLVRDAQATQIVRSYTYPSSLGLEINPATGVAYVVGDSVAQFAPLVKGVELLDYVSDKTWINDYAAEGGAPYLQRFFRFLLRVDYGAFNLAALMFVRDFILKVKPTYTYPIFSVLANVASTSIDVTDEVTFYAKFNIFDTPMSGHNVAGIWDQPEDGYASVSKIPASGPMGSVWKNSYDRTQSGTGVDWGYDKCGIAEEVACTMTLDFVGGTPPLDSIFAWDLPVYDPAHPSTPIYWTYDVVLPAGTYSRDKTL